MIIKTISAKATNAPKNLVYYLLRYSLKDNQPKKDKAFASIVYQHNLRSHELAGYLEEFKRNESFRIYKRKNAAILFHNIISFSPSNKNDIDQTILRNITKQFIQLRGENNLYLSVAHKEKEHIHLHVVNSGIQLNGRSSRVSKQQFASIKLGLEKYVMEKYPMLSPSFIAHEKNSIIQQQNTITKRVKTRTTTKHILKELVANTYTKAISADNFKSLLTAPNREIYYRDGRIQGVIENGIKYRLSRLGIPKDQIALLQEKGEQEKEQLVQLREGNVMSRGRQANRKPTQLSDEFEQLRNSASEKFTHDVPDFFNRPKPITYV